MTSSLRTDLIPTTIDDQRRVIVKTAFSQIIEDSDQNSGRLRSVQSAKDIDDAIELIKTAMDDYQDREGVTEDARVTLVYDRPDAPKQTEVITVTPGVRLPALFERGHPTKTSAPIRATKRIFLEERDDPDNLGYRLAIFSKLYDNWIVLTCWALTTKAASKRAIWLEQVLEEYGWFFTASGINRIIYTGRGERVVERADNNVMYGYPLEVYIRTEKIIKVSEKALERMIVQLNLATD